MKAPSLTMRDCMWRFQGSGRSAACGATSLLSWTITALLLLPLTAVVVGCGDDGNPAGPGQATGPGITPGQVHTELLETIWTDLEMVKATKGEPDRTAEDLIVIAAVNRITDRYGLPRMDPSQVLECVEQGRQMARQDPVRLISDLLEGSEQEWWDRFSAEAGVDNAREVYLRHCELYGMPAAESTLGRALDIALSSAEFWCAHRDNQQPVYRNPYVPGTGEKSWKKFLRYAVSCVVDTASGVLAGGGTAAFGGGPVAGAVVGGIVGGLASHGADEVLFGD